MPARRVLVIEDDPPMADFLNRALSDEGMEPTVCSTVALGIEVVSKQSFDAVVLDWVLPDGEGLSVCTTMRKQGNTTPILMLTARGEVQDRVAALHSGADDYLVKPFELDELVARIESLMRRSTYVSTMRIGSLEIDRVGRRVSSHGTSIDLTNIEYRLLLRLVNEAGTTVDRVALLQDVWGLNSERDFGIIEVQMCRLRDKLGDNAAWMIETVRGKGYRFVLQR